MKVLVILAVLFVSSSIIFSQQKSEKKWFSHPIETAQSAVYEFVPKGLHVLEAYVENNGRYATVVLHVSARVREFNHNSGDVNIYGKLDKNGKWNVSYDIHDGIRRYKSASIERFCLNEVRAAYAESTYTTSIY